MSIGNSGRVVIEIEPTLKRHLYSTLAKQGLTLKDWFVSNAEIFVQETRQMQLLYDETDHSGLPSTSESSPDQDNK